MGAKGCKAAQGIVYSFAFPSVPFSPSAQELVIKIKLVDQACDWSECAVAFETWKGQLVGQAKDRGTQMNNEHSLYRFRAHEGLSTDQKQCALD